MTDVLVYWRDFDGAKRQQKNVATSLNWHSSSKVFRDVLPGDRVWLVTSGVNVSRRSQAEEKLGYLVGVWQVARIQQNPGDDPRYPANDYRYRVIADPSASYVLDDPVPVDEIVRPSSRDKDIAIGRFLQGARRLNDTTVRQLRTVAGPMIATHYLAGRSA